MKCNHDCLNCAYEDCISDDSLTLREYKEGSQRDRDSVLDNEDKPITMTRYLHNRIDKEAYIRARNREYEKKRKGRADRVECKRRQYQRHKEEKIAYQHKYNAEHKAEISLMKKAYYEAHKEEINRKNREAYYRRKEAKLSAYNKEQQAVGI